MSSKTASSPSPSPAPGTSSTSGYFAGGATPATVSTIEKYTYATDTAGSTATNIGFLSTGRIRLSGFGNATDGWYGGGLTTISTIDRIIFASDSSNAVAKGPLSVGRSRVAASGSTTDAWHAGGTSPGPTYSTVDRAIFASDTAAAVAKGPLSSTKYGGGFSGNTTDAWYQGGFQTATPANITESTVDRVIFASDTASAVTKGSLSLARYNLNSYDDNSTYAWATGGFAGSPATRRSTVDRITFSTDTAAAVAKGPLIAISDGHSSVNNTTDAWVAGGLTPAITSATQRSIFSTDTAALVAKGAMTKTTRDHAGSP